MVAAGALAPVWGHLYLA